MKNASSFYDTFSKAYDLASPKWYYKKARSAAVEQLFLKEQLLLLSVACGTGQSFEFYQDYLNGSGLIAAIDQSKGMLLQAQNKIDRHNWSNIKLALCDASTLTPNRINKDFQLNTAIKFDSAICELGLTAMPEWEKVIDNMISLIKPGGRIVIMDWYKESPNLRTKILNWIGNADITRPTWKYLKPRVDNFQLDNRFNRGDVFVASGTTRQS